MKNNNMDWLSEKEQKYGVQNMPFPEWLAAMEKKYIADSGKTEAAAETENAGISAGKSEKPKLSDLTRKLKPFPLPKQPKHEGFIPDKKYVQKLLKNLEPLQENPDSNIREELKKCRSTLEKLIQKNDFDDAEDIMTDIHGMIKKYIYGSDTKVNGNEWDALEDYLRKAGYQPVPVKAGDRIKPYQTMFERPIEASGEGIPGTIKHIQLKPYLAVYWDGTEDKTACLCGKCSYYPEK